MGKISLILNPSGPRLHRDLLGVSLETKSKSSTILKYHLHIYPKYPLFAKWHVFESFTFFNSKCSIWTIFTDKVCSSANLQMIWTKSFDQEKYLSGLYLSCLYLSQFIMKSIYHYLSFKKCYEKLSKYLSTCNISINNLWWLVKQPHYCVWFVRSLPPNYLGLVRFHPHNFKQPEQHMTPVNLDATLYVWPFIISSDMYFWWLHCPPFKP